MTAWPKIAGTLCAQMGRGFSGQDANGNLIVVITSQSKQSANLCGGGGIYGNGENL